MELYRLSEARKRLFDVPPSKRTILYWINTGLNGVRLEAVDTGKTKPFYRLSREIVDRFFAQIAADSSADKYRNGQRKTQIQESERAVQRMSRNGIEF